MNDCEILIIGAGHNALVCAGYLAKAGYRVLVLERRHKIGGAVVTEEIIPGFKFDLGGSAHILIHHTPIVRDLGLVDYGLDYIDLDPILFHPFPDGSSITMWRDIDATCESIAAFSPQDADNYRRFVNRWGAVSAGMVEAFTHAPTPLNLGRYLILSQGLSLSGADKMTELLRGYGQVLRNSFVDPRTPAMIGWMAAQSGPPPTEPLGAPFALWHPMYHVSGMKRPRGGSGMLTQALGRMIEAHGGRIVTSSPVERILVEKGRAIGARTIDGAVYTASRAVVSGAHIKTTMALLDDAAPQKAHDAVNAARIGNGFGMIVRAAVHELPDYTAQPSPTPGGVARHHQGMGMLNPSLEYLEAAYGDYLAGRPSQNPSVIVMTWSAADPSLAPEGKHTVFLWGQYYPYKLADGRSWDDIADEVADSLWATLRAYAPNMTPDKVIGQLVETPLYLERELGLHNGNVMHLEMSVDQMFMMRPTPEMSQYRAPVKRLYITGASTHPGGGIMGAAGMNAAAAVLKDLK